MKVDFLLSSKAFKHTHTLSYTLRNFFKITKWNASAFEAARALPAGSPDVPLKASCRAESSTSPYFIEPVYAKAGRPWNK